MSIFGNMNEMQVISKKIVLIAACIMFFACEADLSLAFEEVKSSISLNSFIKSAEHDRMVSAYKEINDYLDSSPRTTPYLDRIELRSKTDEFDIDKQKYGIRIYPKGLGETKYSDLLSESLKTNGRAEYDAGFNASVMERYRLILKYLENSELISLKQKLLTVCEDRITVLTKRSTCTSFFDVSDLADAEEMLTKTRLDLAKLENQKNETSQRIDALAGGAGKIDFSGQSLISIETVKKRFKKADAKSDFENSDIRSKKNSVDVAWNRYCLEEAKSHDYLSFMEVSYDHDKSNDGEKAWAVSVGLKLPFLNSDQNEITKRKISYLKEKMAYEDEKRFLDEKSASLSLTVSRLIEQYEIIDNANKKGSVRDSLNNSIKAGGADVLNILRAKESLLKNDIHLTQTAYEIRNKYLDQQNISGKLSEMPLRNLITETQEVIQ